MEKLCENINDTYILSGRIRIFDFKKSVSHLTYLGKNYYGDGFYIDQVDIPVIYKLLIYMIKDTNTARKIGIDLSKGILLSGPIGCGKTTLMNLVMQFAHSSDRYKMETCRNITFDFAKNGFDVILKYTTKKHNHSRLTSYCFDDLGAEQQIKHFGVNSNVMAEILTTRHEQFIENGTITHLTTNLSASEIENYYGNRLRSRMRSMFNIIAFSQDSKDKR
jgi:energy-coupling factor transporter ATP-binding protein EcfA2